MINLIFEGDISRLPSYGSLHSKGLDISYIGPNKSRKILIKPLERVCVPTKLYIHQKDILTVDSCLHVCSRSGLALKHGIIVLNAPGIVDLDYKDEIQVILINLSNKEYSIKSGDRIAQLLSNTNEPIRIMYNGMYYTRKDLLHYSSKRVGGFGSTGY